MDQAPPANPPVAALRAEDPDRVGTAPNAGMMLADGGAEVMQTGRRDRRLLIDKAIHLLLRSHKRQAVDRKPPATIVALRRFSDRTCCSSSGVLQRAPLSRDLRSSTVAPNGPPRDAAAMLHEPGVPPGAIAGLVGR